MSTACPFRRLIDLLSFLGSLRGDPELVGFVEVETVIDWVGRRLHAIGISLEDYYSVVDRLAENQCFDGIPSDSVYYRGAGIEPRADLNHVIFRLHQLDQAGTAPRIWPGLCRRWPIFAEGHRASIAGKIEAIHSALQRPASVGSAKTRMTVKEANKRAMKRAKEFGAPFFAMSINKQAELIGCHPLTWRRTAFYKQSAEKGKIAPPKARMKKCLSFAGKVETVTGEGERDEIQQQVAENELRRLRAEQDADFEPSPLEEVSSSRRGKVRSRKRV